VAHPGSVIHWDCAKNAILREEHSFGGATVVCVDFSPDGRQGLLACSDHTLWLWQLSSGEKIRICPPLSGPIHKVLFSPDGKRGLSAGADGTVRLWDLKRREELLRLVGHQGAVRGIAFAPNGLMAASGGEDQRLRLWDLETGQELGAIETAVAMTSLSFAPWGDRLAAAGDDTEIWISRVPSLSLTRKAGLGQVVLDTDTPAVPLLVKQNGQAPRMLLPRSRLPARLPAGDNYTVEPAHPVAGLHLSPTKFSLLPGATQRIEARRGPEYVGMIEVLEADEQPVTALALPSGGKRLLYACRDGRLLSWEVSGSTVRKEWIKAGRTILALSPDGRRAIVQEGKVQVWDVEKEQPMGALPLEPPIALRAAFVPGGEQVLVGGPVGTLRLWDGAGGKLLRSFEGHGSAVLGLAVSPDGKWAVSGGRDCVVRLWDVATGEEVGTFYGHGSAVSGVALSPDGREVLSAGEDGTVRLWDRASGKELRRLVHLGPVLAAAFTPDGKRIVSWRVNEPEIILWEASNGRRLIGFRQKTAYRGEFTPSLVLASTRQGPIRLAWAADGDIHLGQIPAQGPALILPEDRLGEVVLDVHSLPGSVRLRRKTKQATVLTPTTPGPSGAQTFVFGEPGDYTVEVTGARRGVYASPARFTLQPGGQQVVELRAGPDYVGDVWQVHSDFGDGRVVCLPDGRHCLTARGTGMLELWDLHEGRRVRRLLGHVGHVWDLVVTADGARAVSGGEDGTARVWELASGKELNRLKGLQRAVGGALVLATDGKQVVCSEGSRLLWIDPARAERVREVTLPDAFPIISLALSPDGGQLLIGRSNGRVGLADARGGKVEHVFAGTCSGMSRTAFSPDGRLALAWGPGQIPRLWEVDSKKELFFLCSGGRAKGSAAALGPDGRLALSCPDRTVSLWDVARRQEVYRFAAGDQTANPVFTPDGKRLLLCSLDLLLVRQLPGPDIEEGQLVVEQAIPGWLDVGVWQKGRLVFVTRTGIPSPVNLMPGEYELRLNPNASQGAQLSETRVTVKAGQLHKVRLIPEVLPLPKADPERFAFSSFVAAAAEALSGLPSPLDSLQPGSISRPMRERIGGGYAANAPASLVAVLGDVPPQGHAASLHTLALRRDGALLATGDDAGVVRVWDLASGKDVRSWTAHKGEVRAAAFNPDSKLLATAGADARVVLWDADTGKQIRAIHDPNSTMRALLFSRDGRTLMTGGKDGKLRRWSVADGRLLETLRPPGLDGEIIGMALSPDGSLLALSQKNRAGKWNAQTAAYQQTWSSSDAQGCLAFSPDGRLLASSDSGTEVTLRGSTYMSLLQTLSNAHSTSPLACLAWRGDGRQIAAVRMDGAVTRWDLDTGEIIEEIYLPPGASAGRIVFSPDGRYLLVSHSDGLVSILRLKPPPGPSERKPGTE
jgi:WD40 repeat protein